MAEKAEHQNERKRETAPWIWSLIWSILGVLLALLIIFLMTWPFLWLLGWFGVRGDSAATAALRATQTTIAQTVTAEALRGPETPVAGSDQGDGQTSGDSQNTASQTSTAQTEAGQSGETGSENSADDTGGTATPAPAGDEGDPALTPTATPRPSPSTPNPAQAVASEGEVDVYLGPAFDYPIVATLPANVPLPVIGQNESGDWWQIQGPDGSSGWVPADQVTASNSEGVPVSGGPQAVADNEIDLYFGPGISYPIVATVPSNTPLPVIGQTEAGDWWQVVDPAGTVGWVPGAAVSVANAAEVPPAQPPRLSAASAGDLYLGPGTVYPVIGSLPANVPLPLTGQNADDNWWQALDPAESNDWWQLTGPDGSAGWVPAGQVTVENAGDVPLAQGPEVTATDEEDLYFGPGIDYPIITTFPADLPLPVVGRNQDRSWWQVLGPDETLGWVPDLLVTAVNTAPVPEVEAPPLPEPTAEASEFGNTRGGDYIVQRDDWLSKLSDKFYSSPIAYWPIIAGTNRANAENPNYARITDADFIEIGDRLLIPSAVEAEAFLQDFDPATDAASIGLTVVTSLGVTSNITATNSLTLTGELTDTLGVTVTLSLTDTNAITGTNESN